MPAQRMGFWDADQLFITFGGYRIQDFADGEFCVIEQMSEGFTSVVGSDGSVARSKTNDRRVKVTVKILQTSVSNDVLSAMHKFDLNSAGGSTHFMHIEDGGGTTYVNAPTAWIVKYPDQSMDREAKMREWVFECAVGDRHVGGNPL